jgi:hypothetical protein
MMPAAIFIGAYSELNIILEAKGEAELVSDMALVLKMLTI